MQITAKLYSEFERLIEIGELEFLHDRIISVSLKIPVSRKKISSQKKKCSSTVFKKSEEVYQAYEWKDAFVFELERNSKADWPYRKYGLTHRLTCVQLDSICPSPIYIKLSLTQVARINYSKKKYVWQTKPFQQKLLEETSKWILITLLGGLLTLVLVSVNKNSKDKPPEGRNTMVPVNNSISKSIISEKVRTK